MFAKTPKVEQQIKIAPKVTSEVKQTIIKPLPSKQPTAIKPVAVVKPPAKKQLIEIQDVQILQQASIPMQQLKMVSVIPQNQKVFGPVSMKSSQQPIRITNIITTAPTTTTNIVTTVRQAQARPPSHVTVRPPSHVTVMKLPHTKPTEIKKRNSAGISVQISKPESSIPKETGCIVCKVQTRKKANYCSDECLRKYVTFALPKAIHSDDEVASKKAKKNLFEDLLLSADSKPKYDRVCVFERSTGQILTGCNAPTSANLRKWLQDHPTFEVVQSGTTQASEVEVSLFFILFFLFNL